MCEEERPSVRGHWLLILWIGLLGFTVRASEIDTLKSQIEAIHKELDIRNNQKVLSSRIGSAETAVDAKFSADSLVTTKSGKLQIGGLLQVWVQHIQNDSVGIVHAADGNFLDSTPGAFPAPESNETLDNDTFRIRRAELRFTLDIHENIKAHLKLDPARETNVFFTPAPAFPRHNNTLGTYSGINGNIQTGAGIQLGNSITPQLLQDVYLNFHGIVPHHDFTLGQFNPPMGEEAWRHSGQLDFVERAMVTNVNNVRDIGAMIHGTWLENRVQYWVGAFNGPDGTVLPYADITEGGNRSDDNDAKDIVVRLAVRPVWNAEKWHGCLEVGGARTDGIRGESGNGYDPSKAINGLNRTKTDINRTAAWVWYRPGGEVRGWWFRGEYGNAHDRYGPTNNFTTGLLGLGGNITTHPSQLDPTPVTAEGWYFGTGYKLSESRWATDLKSGSDYERFLCNLEFAFRYEVYENVATEDLVRPDRQTDQFKTAAYTGGINYYIKGHDAKIQANYIWVNDPGNHNRGLREVKNNQFILNFQVMF
jgi:hypothetical protein